jgi:hypothetical protein
VRAKMKSISASITSSQGFSLMALGLSIGIWETEEAADGRISQIQAFGRV